MAENPDSSQERSLEPTPKKLLDARKKGQVARSRELNTTVMLLSATAAIYVYGEHASFELMGNAASTFSIERGVMFDRNAVITQLADNFIASLWLLAPLFFFMTCACIVGPLLVGGFSFSRESYKPKASRMNPLSGLKRMFGTQGLVELLKSVAKFLLLLLVAWWLFYLLTERYLTLGVMPLGQGVSTALSMIVLVFATLSATTLLIALIDVPYQKWEHIRKLRMTPQELKEENKESEGNPEVRARVRKMQQETANRKMLVAVKTSDVVVINPTHYSVALKYDKEGDGAPVVVAKGVDHMALNIREVAKKNDVLLFRNVTLARALYHHVKIDQEIPLDLYNIVAQVLAYVFQLQEFRQGNAIEPDYPALLSLPASMRNSS